MSNKTLPPQLPKNAPKPQAVSHMLMFFVLPCLGFIGWASWSLVTSLMENKAKDIPARIEAVKSARSSGDRWQAVYSLSQELQKMKVKGEWETAVTPEQKKKLFLTLVEMQKEHGADFRFKKYVLLTLGQFGTEDLLPHIEGSLKDTNEEIRFFAAWAFLELLGRSQVEHETHYATVEKWLEDEDVSFRKISATFLAQKKTNPPLVKIKTLLKDPEVEVRWNTAVALASIGDRESIPTLLEMFDIKNIRKLDVRSVDDLKQLLASAHDAAKKLDSEEVFAAEEALLATLNPETPEGKTIFEALGRENSI